MRDSIQVGPHEFERLSWWRRHLCRRCYVDREVHPTGWVRARPLGDKRDLRDVERG